MFVIPIEKNNPIRHIPWAVYSFIMINTLIFFVTFFFFKSVWFYNSFGFIPSEHKFFTAITSMFIHAGFFHILGNMFFLWMFGDNIEDVIGPFIFIFVYILCGFAATALHYYFNPDSLIPCVGASGAISGIVGVYLIFFPRIKTDLVFYIFRFEVNTITTTASVAIIAWFFEQTTLGLLTHLTALKSYISTAFWAHVGGFIAGVIIGWCFVLLGYKKRYIMKKQLRHPILGYA